MAALLAVHPHPDDESIACGGVLSLAVDAGHRVGVVTCTGGEAGDNLAGIDLGDDDLVTHRRRELADALRILGVDDHTWLGYRDSGMAGTAENTHPDAFCRADLYEAAARLGRLIRSFRPDVVVSDGPDGTYGHPDHIQAHRVTERAVTLAADPWWDTPAAGEPFHVRKRYVYVLTKERIFDLHQRLTAAGLASPFGEGPPPESPEDLPVGTWERDVTTRVDISPVIERKQAAMAAHRSQIAADSFFLNLPDDVAAEVFATEEFVLTSGTPDGTPETSLLG